MTLCIASDAQEPKETIENKGLWYRGSISALIVDNGEQDWSTTQEALSARAVDLTLIPNDSNTINTTRRLRADLILAAQGSETTALFKAIRENLGDTHVVCVAIGRTDTPSEIGITICSDAWTESDIARLTHALQPRDLWKTIQDKELRIQKLSAQGIEEAHQLTNFFKYAQRSLKHMRFAPTNPDAYAEMMATYILRRTPEDLLRPAMLLITRRDAKGRHSGFLYSRSGTRVQRHPGPFNMTSRCARTIFIQGRDAFQWMQSEKNKNPFGRALQRAIGHLDNFVSTATEEWGLVAINAAHPATENTGSMLQSVLMHTQALTDVSTRLESERQRGNASIQALFRMSQPHREHATGQDERINEISGLLASALGCTETFVDQISTFACLRDIGKAILPQSILTKTRALTPKEWEHVKTHPVHGARLIGDEPTMHMAHEIALCHHERYDGTGYPYGLCGEEIPLAARIVAAVDVYSALRSKRPYRAALSHRDAIKCMVEGDSRMPPQQFDPNVMAIFLIRQLDIENIWQGDEQSTPGPDSTISIQAIA